MISLVLTLTAVVVLLPAITQSSASVTSNDTDLIQIEWFDVQKGEYLAPITMNSRAIGGGTKIRL